MSLGGDSFRWADIRWAEATTSFFEFAAERRMRMQNAEFWNAKRRTQNAERKELGITKKSESRNTYCTRATVLVVVCIHGGRHQHLNLLRA